MLQILECSRRVIFFFFLESFDVWRIPLMITFYHQTKRPIDFLYKRGLNPKSLLQSSETLQIELTEPTLIC